MSETELTLRVEKLHQQAQSMAEKVAESELQYEEQAKRLDDAQSEAQQKQIELQEITEHYEQSLEEATAREAERSSISHDRR